MSVNIAVGLGNSEARYALTRHNAGAIVLEGLAKSCGVPFMRFNKYANAYLAKGSIGSCDLTFAFAEGYMNESGKSLAKILKYLKADISSVAVIYDDITLEVGRMKLTVGGSSGGHNGVADIMECCGKLSEPDLAAIGNLPVKLCFELLVSKGIEAAQNVINRKS